jgi:lipoate-protein ligase B
MKLIRIDLGLTKYKKAWDIQKQLVELRYKSAIDDCLILTEHQPVITMGRGTDKNNLLVSSEMLKERNVDLYEIERGGDITFHGPGQSVLYPIIDLRNRAKDAHRYLRDLEQVAIMALAKLSLKAEIKEGLTGIWVDDHKVGAIGVAVSRWITYHGMAINVDTDLSYFDLINPCGITQYPVGSVSELLGQKVMMNDINNLLVESMVGLFGYDGVTVEDIADIL